MRCEICNYQTDREDHYIRHNNTNKHYKNRYKYLKMQKQKMKDNIERIDDVIKQQLENNIIVEYVEMKHKEEPEIKTKKEILPMIAEAKIKLINNGIDLENEITNYNYYIKNYSNLNIYELNDFYDELDYLMNKNKNKMDIFLNDF